MGSSRVKIRTWAAAMLAGGLIIAGCGTDDNGDDPAEDVTDTETTEDADAGADDDWPDEIILGLVPSQEVDQLVEDAQVLGDLLEAELGVSIDTFVPTDYTALVVAMQTGQAHIGMFGPIALVQAADQAGASVTLQSIRRGSSSYHTQWFTNAENADRFCLDDVVTAENPEGNTFSYCNGTDSASEGPVGEEALNNIEEGETVYFVDAGSASGYYYPATQIQTVAGIDPIDGIDGQFAGSHQATVQNVQRGDAAVGVSFDDARNDLIEEDENVGEDVIVFAWSEEIPNDGVAIAGDLPQSLQDAITQAFLDIIETEDGGQAFFDVYSIEGLVPADLDALDVARQVEANFG
jgi:phosphonate transport system substrate-binding protein